MEAFQKLLLHADYEVEEYSTLAYSFIPLLRATDESDARHTHQQHAVVYFTKIAERIRKELSELEIVLVPYGKETPLLDREGRGRYVAPSQCRVGPANMYLLAVFYLIFLLFRKREGKGKRKWKRGGECNIDLKKGTKYSENTQKNWD